MHAQARYKHTAPELLPQRVGWTLANILVLGRRSEPFTVTWTIGLRHDRYGL